MKHCERILGVTLVGLALMSGPALAQVPGVLTRADSGQTLTGMIRWLSGSKAYTVRPQGSGSGVEIRIPEADVASVRIRRPDAFDTAVKEVNAGNYDRAIPMLVKLVKDYERLEWDLPAAQYLAFSYLKTQKAKQAVTMAQRVLRGNPAAIRHRPFLSVYWDALLEAEDFGTLRGVLSQAAAEGTREVAAVAQVKRGDLDRREGRPKDALVDGYLRTIYFFKNVREVQPEALYKAAQAFAEINQHNQADAMRKELMRQFPDSEYARRAQTGS